MQKPEYCVLCRSKLDSIPCFQYTSEGFAHTSCIIDKFCVFCGISGLCIRCHYRDCSRTFHHHCSLHYLTKDSTSNFCDLHRRSKSKRKDFQRLWLARQVSNRVSQSPDLIRKVKLDHSDTKSSSICTGQVFWFCLNSQFFPSFQQWTKPEIPVRAEIDFNTQWPENLISVISDLETEYSDLQAKNKEILESVSLTPSIELKDLKEDELILAETRNLSLKEGLESYLRYFESKVREETEAGGSAEKRSSGLGGVVRDEEDFICGICGDGDYEDDDLIVICSVCEIGAHMKCYGILVVPEDDWVCHGCRDEKWKNDRIGVKCALCPVRGGCVKPTVHVVSDSEHFPNYSEPGERVWCHLFCATHLDFSVFGAQDSLDDIDLRKIDPERFQLKCFICKTKDGACLQCQFGRCQTAFHPECGKDLFTNTRDKTGSDEISYFCPVHKPLKLRKILESKEKKCVDDVLSFAKYFERLEKRAKPIFPPPVKRVNSERPFSYDEKCKLIKLLESEVSKVRQSASKEFSVYVKLSPGSLRHKIEVSRPESFNILDPQTITQHKLAIKGRKPTECQKFYSEHIYPIMKKELEIMNMGIIQFCPASKNVTIKKKLAERSFKMEMPKKDVIYVQQKLDSVIVEDVVTKEVYCICKKPFVEKSVKRVWETELEFLKRTEESKMIQCEDCDEWYHYKCVGIDFANLPERYSCTMCEAKVKLTD